MKLILAVAGLAFQPLLAGPSMMAGFEPAQRSAVSQSPIKLLVPRIVEGDTLTRVRFFARYSVFVSNKMDHAVQDTLLADDSVPPFELLWDITRLPDQDDFNLKVRYALFTRKGELRPPDGSQWILPLALDRNPGGNRRALTAARTAGIRIDGGLSDWAVPDSARFDCGDNLVTFRAGWSDSLLFFGVRVSDSALFPETADSLLAKIPSYLADGVEIFLDALNDRGSARRDDDVQLLVSCLGSFNQFAAPRNAGSSNPVPRALPQVAVRKGPGGYAVEAAFSWKELGVKPQPGRRMGFNLVNTDREEKAGVVMTRSWAGITDIQHHNPSEWGTLVLADSSGAWRFRAVLIAVFLVLGAAGFVLVRRRGKGGQPGKEETTPPEDASIQKKLVDSMKRYMEDHLADDDLDLTRAATSINLSPNYCGKLFKRETGENFSEYLNRIRIERSKILLSGSNKRITEIAFETGYGSLEHFVRVFKGLAGVTPTEYRKVNFKPLK